jgi:hypothetical protein
MRLTGVLMLLLAVLHMSSASTWSRETSPGLQQVKISSSQNLFSSLMKIVLSVILLNLQMCTNDDFSSTLVCQKLFSKNSIYIVKNKQVVKNLSTINSTVCGKFVEQVIFSFKCRLFAIYNAFIITCLRLSEQTSKTLATYEVC